RPRRARPGVARAGCPGKRSRPLRGIRSRQGEPSILVGGEGADPTPIIAAMRGLHLTADLRGCAAARPVMTTPAVLRSTCLAAVAAAGLSAVGELFHRFTPPPPGRPAPARITGLGPL